MEKAIKAISDVIAALLVLVVVIGLMGLTYSYIMGVFSSKTSQTFQVLDIYNDTITISNTGTSPITQLTGTISSPDEQSAVLQVTPVDSSLVACWHFDEGSGSVVHDYSGYNNDGTLVNGPTWVDGKYGKALSFDGVDDYVKIPKNVVSDDMTLIIWIYPKVISDGNYHGFAGYQGASLYYRPFNLWVDPGAGLHWWISKSDNSQIHKGYIYNFFESANKWYFIAFRKSGTKLTVFKNDVKYDLPDSPFTDLYKPTEYWIGRVDKYFNGTIDEVRIYNRALSDEEIKQLYYDGLNNAFNVSFTMLYTGVQAPNIGKDFTATIFLSNGTTITKIFSLDNPLGITNALARVNLTIDNYYPSYGLIDKVIVCSVSCPGICAELPSTEC